MHCNGFAKITRTDKDCLVIVVKTENVLDFLFQLTYAVTVTLLTETAEAVKILSYLLGGHIHNLCKLS